MRIAMMTNNYKPIIGGVPISIERLSEGLRQLGHTVYIFAPDCGDNGPDDPYVIRCQTLERWVAGNFPILNMLDRNIERLFSALNIDIIHVHHPVIMGQIALYLGQKYQIPVVYTYHTRYEMYLHYFKSYAWLQNYVDTREAVALCQTARDMIRTAVPGFIKHFINQCDLVFAPTETIAQYLDEQCISVPVQVMPTGLPIQAFSQDQNTAQCLRNRFLSGKKYLLCTVSRLAKEKNLSFLLRGLAILKEQIGNSFKMLIIGDGPERAVLEHQAVLLGLHENVIFLGFLPNDQIGLYHRACDLFLFASRSETQGIVLLEAMAARNPVIALEATGVEDVIENGRNGYMTVPDEKCWAECIRQVLEQDSLHHRMSEGAFQTAKKYSAVRIARTAEQSYRQVLYGRAMMGMEIGFPLVNGKKTG